MHHIRASEIPMSRRRPHLTAYAAQVRRALMDPSLPAGQRAKLERSLARIRASLQSGSP